MDAFLTFCQALGIGLAVGALAGGTGLDGAARGGITLLAVGVGAAAGAISASLDDEALALGILGGLLGAGVACVVVSGIVAGAARRGGRSGAVAFLISLAALVVAGLSVLVPPLALLPLAALLWLASARRRRAQRKYEGLRVLR